VVKNSWREGTDPKPNMCVCVCDVGYIMTILFDFFGRITAHPGHKKVINKSMFKLSEVNATHYSLCKK